MENLPIRKQHRIISHCIRIQIPGPLYSGTGGVKTFAGPCAEQNDVTGGMFIIQDSHWQTSITSAGPLRR